MNLIQSLQNQLWVTPSGLLVELIQTTPRLIRFGLTPLFLDRLEKIESMVYLMTEGPINEDQPILLLESVKAAYEVTPPCAGVITQVNHNFLADLTSRPEEFRKKTSAFFMCEMIVSNDFTHASDWVPYGSV